MNLALRPSPVEAKPTVQHGTLGTGRDRQTARVIRPLTSSESYGLLTGGILLALAVSALFTFRDYAISNDEGVQHHYGELIIAYYRTGFAARDLFTFQNLYLYGGLFDIIAVALAHVTSVDPYDLRHILCAMTGIGGIAASAATARLIAGPRAGLIATVALTLCGAWYGAMFNHTKDIPFAAAMMGATLFLIRNARALPAPRGSDVAAFGLFAGAALGERSLGLLLFVYLALAIILYLPWRDGGRACAHLAVRSALRTFPGLALAYIVMILAWPWAALLPLNPIRGLFAFSEFHYSIRTIFAGQTYQMANVPRIYVPCYVLIRLPLITLAGALLAVIPLFLRAFERDGKQQWRDIAIILLAVIVPLASEVAFHGPAFTGMRHFLFVLPPIATLAGVGFSRLLDALESGRQLAFGAAVTLISACFLWEGALLVRLHPYENLSYNALVGGLEGAFRRYDMDYWFNSMPEAIHRLEAYLRTNKPLNETQPLKIYSVAVCGERLTFDRTVTLPQLQWDFRPAWEDSEFFIATTHMSCDRDLDGEIVGTVERFGVPIAYVKDRRAIMQRATASRALPQP